MKRKDYIDIDGLKAGDELDRQVAKNVYSKLCDSSWFIPIKGRKRPQYFGPRFSTDLKDSMEALTEYVKRYGYMIKSYCLIEQTEKGPYSCTAEMRIATGTELSYVRSWAPTMPHAIARMLSKVPTK